MIKKIRGYILGSIAISGSLFLTACSTLSPMEQRSLLENQAAQDQYAFESLPMGLQGSPKLETGVVELPTGKTFYKGYSLAKGHGVLSVQLRTYIQHNDEGDGFFYPVVELFDYNLKPIEVIRPQLRFTQLSSQGRYAAIPLTLTRDVGYLVIRTEPKLYGQEASYTTKHQGASWSYSVTPFAKRKPASYLPLGTVELLTPDEGFSRPYEKMSGAFWQFSMNKSGTKLASSEDYLPDLTLGSGPEFAVGYAFGISGRPSTSIRTSLGYSYLQLSDEGTHEQSLASADLLWVESNHVSSIGFGLTSRFGHEYTLSGNTTEFDPAFGPKVLLEIRGSMGVSIGVQAAWLEYKDQAGQSYDGDYVGFYLAKFY